MKNIKKSLPVVKKSVLVRIGAIVGVLVVLIVVLAIVNNHKKSNQALTYKTVRVCDIFTLADAKKVLGPTAQASSTTASDSSRESVEVSINSCVYTAGAQTEQNTNTMTSVSILARVAKNKAGAASNAAQFSSAKPRATQPVSGYGDAAYWSPIFGQLNILKHNNWYILSNGPIIHPQQRTLANTKKLADIVISRL